MLVIVDACRCSWQEESLEVDPKERWGKLAMRGKRSGRQQSCDYSPILEESSLWHASASASAPICSQKQRWDSGDYNRQNRLDRRLENQEAERRPINYRDISHIMGW